MLPKPTKSIKARKYIKRRGKRTIEYDKWRDNVAIPYLDETFGRKCVDCDATEDLQVDHLLGRGSHPHLKMKLFNLQYLCPQHHHDKTNHLGKYNLTKGDIMSNEKTLEKAIKKAIKGGWKPPYGFNETNMPKYLLRDDSVKYDDVDLGSIQELVFNHDFAKALWGDEEQNYMWVDCIMGHQTAVSQLAWAIHLQEMVLAEDPLKYLVYNLPTE